MINTTHEAIRVVRDSLEEWYVRRDFVQVQGFLDRMDMLIYHS